MEMVTLDNAGKALALAHANDVDVLTDGKYADGDRLADFHFRIL